MAELGFNSHLSDFKGHTFLKYCHLLPFSVSSLQFFDFKLVCWGHWDQKSGLWSNWTLKCGVIKDNYCMMEKLSCEKSVFNYPYSFYLCLSRDKDPTLSRPCSMLLYNGFIMVIVFF